jgi:hypothetical protein
LGFRARLIGAPLRSKASGVTSATDGHVDLKRQRLEARGKTSQRNAVELDELDGVWRPIELRLLARWRLEPLSDF